MLQNNSLLNFTMSDAPAYKTVEKSIKEQFESIAKHLDKSYDKSEQERIVLRDLKLLMQIEPTQFMVKLEPFNLIQTMEMALRRV